MRTSPKPSPIQSALAMAWAARKRAADGNHRSLIALHMVQRHFLHHPGQTPSHDAMQALQRLTEGMRYLSGVDELLEADDEATRLFARALIRAADAMLNPKPAASGLLFPPSPRWMRRR